MVQIPAQNDPPIVAHMSTEEVEELNRIQGGADWNEELGLYQFFKLGQILKIPEIRDAIETAMEGMKKTPPRERDTVERKLDTFVESRFGDERPLPPHPDENPLAEEIAEHGKEGDDQLVMMPLSMAKFLASLMGTTLQEITNPETGLPQFFKLGKIISKPFRSVGKALGVGKDFGKALGVIGGVVGYMAGGPAGAGVGSGLGRMTGELMHGDDFEGAARRGFETGIGAGALAYGGTSLLGGMGGAGAPGGYGGGGLAPASIFDIGPSGSIQGMTHLAGTGGSPPDSPGSGAGSFSGWGSLLSPQYMLPALGSGLMYKGHQDEEKYKRRALDQYEKEREERAKALRDQTEIDEPLHLNRTEGFEGIPDIPRRENLAGGFARPYIRARTRPQRQYKKGGYVKESETVRKIAPVSRSRYIEGTEKGQADNIHVDVPHGSYVVDASTISDLGDGSSKAGGEVIDNFVSRLPSHSSKKDKNAWVPCALSAGEYVLTPEKVNALGNGSNTLGSRLLKRFVKEVRVHKNSKEDGLPPAALNIETYFKRAAKGGKI